ncbi:hypothetical protein GUJ93_ZPchr0002g24452 [Zizania palustris]|uniref:No apical meristem-associated C-terminal domain-containing protein n=1 Tax=Zizania palustris TaxID=103762 RepID=A0A8J5RIC4_ZIZPA|nr:hypothetical protein GUJ93_ZPchr0002g24452 [Zizania palustris]
MLPDPFFPADHHPTLYQILNRRQSGMTEKDYVAQALSLYKAEHEGKQFRLMHCWNMLHPHPKWTSRLSHKKQKTNINATPDTSCNQAEEISDSDTPHSDFLRRPAGKKAGKTQL